MATPTLTTYNRTTPTLTTYNVVISYLNPVTRRRHIVDQEFDAIDIVALLNDHVQPLINEIVHLYANQATYHKSVLCEIVTVVIM